MVSRQFRESGAKTFPETTRGQQALEERCRSQLVPAFSGFSSAPPSQPLLPRASNFLHPSLLGLPFRLMAPGGSQKRNFKAPLHLHILLPWSDSPHISPIKNTFYLEQAADLKREEQISNWPLRGLRGGGAAGCGKFFSLCL